MSKRRDIKESVFEKEQYDGEWPPTDAEGFIDFFQKKFSLVPAAFRDSIKVKIDSVSSWEDSHYARLSIEYTRPETDAKYESRKNEEKRQEAYQEQKTYSEYLRLKNKFESKA